MQQQWIHLSKHERIYRNIPVLLKRRIIQIKINWNQLELDLLIETKKKFYDDTCKFF